MAVVIYQCFMTIPVLAVIPLLAAGPMQGAPVPRVFETLEVCAAITTVYLFTRYAAAEGPGYGTPANTAYEAFTLIVIAAILAAAWVMDTVGLSNALGAFMVGMILSASVFAYQIKASVSSIKGLLLSVFFIAIGMSINLKEVIGIGGELLYYLPVSVVD